MSPRVTAEICIRIELMDTATQTCKFIWSLSMIEKKFIHKNMMGLANFFSK